MIKYLPRDFYNLNIINIRSITWLPHNAYNPYSVIEETFSEKQEIDMTRYVYKIFNVVYTEDTPEFLQAIDHSKMWDKLRD